MRGPSWNNTKAIIYAHVENNKALKYDLFRTLSFTIPQLI